ncbi:hypothetical protein ENSA7_04310 [Enhygromyxa salina]|uniref:Uncharacterized protein n=1 Tax=Enhygromyxa salina TaxID=215803 RepID=A0A2S9YXR9_9BACT|nr:hypothetical protein ENSA7_04310 [Enhygromyxa salina]
MGDLLVAVQIDAGGPCHEVAREPAAKQLQRDGPAVAEQEAQQHRVAVVERGLTRVDRRVLLVKPQQRRVGGVAAKPVDELTDRVDHLDPNDPIELAERLKVVLARGRGGERRTHGDLEFGEPGADLVGQEQHLGLRPDPGQPHPTRSVAIGREHLGQPRTLEVVERDRVDHRDVLGVTVGLGERKPSALRVANTVLAKLGQVRALLGLTGIVPVPDMHDTHELVRLRIRPLHHALDRTLGRDFPKQTQRLGVPHMQLVWDRVKPPDRLDEVVLQALRDQ